MYNGEDIPWLASHLTGRLDAVWGSRRLSVRDIEESLRVKYQHSAVLPGDQPRGQPRAQPDVPRALRPIRVGHALGRPCGARRRRLQHPAAVDPQACEPGAALASCCAARPRCSRCPVHFYSVSPHQVKRTTVARRPPVGRHNPLVASCGPRTGVAAASAPSGTADTGRQRPRRRRVEMHGCSSCRRPDAARGSAPPRRRCSSR